MISDKYNKLCHLLNLPGNTRLDKLLNTAISKLTLKLQHLERH